MNKIVIAIVAVAVVIVGGYFLLKSQQPSTPNSNIAPQRSSQGTPQTFPSSTAPAPVTQETPSVKNVVTYDELGFSPNIIRVKVGTTVIFKNQESELMWVASNPHPIHTDYSGLDAKRGYAKGESYSFTFTKSGSRKYHNHLNPGEGGTIIVE